MASRSTSTWRARPWQACTCRLRSARVEEVALVRRPGSGALQGAARSAWTSAWRRCSSVSSASLSGWCTSANGPPSAVEHELHLAGVAAPGGEERVAGDGGRRVVVAAWDAALGRPPARRCAPTAPATGGAGRGGRPGPRRGRRGPRRSWQARRVRPNSESRGGRSTRLGSPRSRAQASVSRSAGLGVPIRSAEPAPQRRLPGDVRAGAAWRWPSVSSPAPTLRSWPDDGRRSGRTGRRGGARRANRPVVHDLVVLATGGAEVGGERGHPTVAEMLVDDGEQRPDRPLRPPRIVVGVDPGGAGERVTRRAGRGTGSRRWRTRRPGGRGDAPSTVDSRWVSQRSMPRVGTLDDLRRERVVERDRPPPTRAPRPAVGPLRSMDRQHRSRSSSVLCVSRRGHRTDRPSTEAAPPTIARWSRPAVSLGRGASVSSSKRSWGWARTSTCRPPSAGSSRLPPSSPTPASARSACSTPPGPP